MNSSPASAPVPRARRWRLGQRVLDKRTGEVATITRIVLVPEATDLVGDLVPAHRRYHIEYDDWRWANDRTDDDLEVPA